MVFVLIRKFKENAMDAVGNINKLTKLSKEGKK